MANELNLIKDPIRVRIDKICNNLAGIENRSIVVLGNIPLTFGSLTSVGNLKNIGYNLNCIKLTVSISGPYKVDWLDCNGRISFAKTFRIKVFYKTSTLENSMRDPEKPVFIRMRFID